MVLFDFELEFAHIAAEGLVFPVLDIVITVVLAVKFDGAFAVDNLAEFRLVRLRYFRQAGAVVHFVQVFECFDRVAFFVIGLGQIEVCLGQAEEREFEPDARSGFVVELDRRSAALTRFDGGREIGLLLPE